MGSTPTFGTIRYNGKQYLGAWLSLVERSVRVAEVGGSNPLAPTKPKTEPTSLCPNTAAMNGPAA